MHMAREGYMTWQHLSHKAMYAVASIVGAYWVYAPTIPKLAKMT